VELELLGALLETGVTEPCLPLLLGVIVTGFVADLDGVVDRATPFTLREANREGDLKPTGDWGIFPGFKVNGGSINFRMSSTSGGIRMLWTLLTAGQSAAGIFSTSSGYGGRQQPGHPGLL